jgi:hypothetical protein
VQLVTSSPEDAVTPDPQFLCSSASPKVSFGPAHCLHFNPKDPPHCLSVSPRVQEENATISGLIMPTTLSNSGYCIVISNTWTAWIYLLGTLHLTCLGIFCHSNQSDWATYAQQHGPLPSSLWYPIAQLSFEVQHILEERLSMSLICLVHHSTVLSSIPSSWFSTHRFLWSGLSSHEAVLPHVCTISHVEAGGGGGWMEFGSSVPTSLLLGIYHLFLRVQSCRLYAK